jgi:hypothetical protein
LAGLRTAFGTLADLRKQRDALTASATVQRGRITVVVNASGAVIETRFADDIGDLSYSEIAQATVQAAQQAAERAADELEELTATVRELRARVPRLHEMVPGLPDLRAELPGRRKASVEPPSMREDVTAGMEFEDAVEYDSGHRSVMDR